MISFLVTDVFPDVKLGLPWKMVLKNNNTYTTTTNICIILN